MAGLKSRLRLILLVIAAAVIALTVLLLVAEALMGCSQVRVYDVRLQEDRLECDDGLRFLG